MSRALGDFVFKKNEKKPAEEQIVTAYPDVTVEKITLDHEFLVLACDGIWDVLSNKEVVDFVRGRLAQKMEPHMVSFKRSARPHTLCLPYILCPNYRESTHDRLPTQSRSNCENKDTLFAILI